MIEASQVEVEPTKVELYDLKIGNFTRAFLEVGGSSSVKAWLWDGKYTWVKHALSLNLFPLSPTLMNFEEEEDERHRLSLFPTTRYLSTVATTTIASCHCTNLIAYYLT